ncbi:CBS domain-containing protein [Chloroflexota bacterium]
MKNVTVGEVHRIHGIVTCPIHEDTPLEEVINRLVNEPVLRGIILIDSNKRFSGVITLRDLEKWARFKLFGGKGRLDISAWYFFRILEAKKAKELLTTDKWSLAVNEADNLQTALDKMLDYDTGVLAVVDGEGRILGDITLSDVLSKAIELGKQMGESKK